MPAGSVVLRKFLGVDRSKKSRDISDQHLETAKNTVSRLDGSEMKLRPQFATPVDAYVDNFSSISPLTKMAMLMSFYDQFGGYNLVMWRGQETGSAVVGARITKIGSDPTIAAPIELATTSTWRIPILERPSWLTWQNKLYIFTGTHQPAFVVEAISPGNLKTHPLNSIGWTAIPGTTTVYNPRLAIVTRQQFMLAGFDSPNESMVRFTDVNNPALLLPDSKALFVGPGDGDRVVGLTEVPVIGGDKFVEPYQLVFKRRSVWMIQGDPPDAATVGNQVVSRILPREGLCSKETISASPHGVIWCSGKNVYLAASGAQPVPIGDKIAPVLKRAPFYSEDWSGVFYDGFYRLTVPNAFNAEAGLDGIQAQSDFDCEQWWCDLREYPEKEPTWWGPMTLPLIHQLVEDVRGVGERLLAVARIPLEDMCFISHEIGDNEKSRDEYGQYVWKAPEQEMRFKEFDFGDPMVDKLVQAMELEIRANKAESVRVEMLGHGGAVQQVPSDTSIGGVGFGFTLGTSLVGSGVLTEEFQVVPIFPPDGGRYIAKTWQPVVKSLSNGDLEGQDVQLRALGVRVRTIGRRPG